MRALPIFITTLLVALLTLALAAGVGATSTTGEHGAAHTESHGDSHGDASHDSHGDSHGDSHAPIKVDAKHDAHNMEDMGDKGHDHQKLLQEAARSDEFVGVKEHLGDIVPDIPVVDENGNTRPLSSYLDKPTVLLPVYYTCPTVCNLLQSTFGRILPEVKLNPGEEVQVLSVSFDDNDTAEAAAKAKKNYTHPVKGTPWVENWHFLTGAKDDVQKLMDAIGFHYKRVEDQFAHPVVVVVLAPGGKVVRYLYGVNVLPFDVTMAATEAAQGKVGVSLKRMLSFCYSYDPQGRKYVFNIMRVFGAGILLFIVGLVTLLMVMGKKKKQGK